MSLRNQSNSQDSKFEFAGEWVMGIGLVMNSLL